MQWRCSSRSSVRLLEIQEFFLGQGLVNSFFKGDDTTGTLTSPGFKIERPFLSFLIGGGGWPETCMNLRVEGKTVRTATGPNTQSGGSEKLDVNDKEKMAKMMKDAKDMTLSVEFKRG